MTIYFPDIPYDGTYSVQDYLDKHPEINKYYWTDMIEARGTNCVPTIEIFIECIK